MEIVSIKRKNINKLLNIKEQIDKLISVIENNKSNGEIIGDINCIINRMCDIKDFYEAEIKSENLLIRLSEKHDVEITKETANFPESTVITDNKPKIKITAKPVVKEKQEYEEVNENKRPHTCDDEKKSIKEYHKSPLEKAERYIIKYFKYEGDNEHISEIAKLNNQIEDLKVKVLERMGKLYIEEIKQYKENLMIKDKTLSDKAANRLVNEHLIKDLKVCRTNPDRFKRYCKEAYLITINNLFDILYYNDIDGVIEVLDRIKVELLTEK